MVSLYDNRVLEDGSKNFYGSFFVGSKNNGGCLEQKLTDVDFDEELELLSILKNVEMTHSKFGLSKRMNEYVEFATEIDEILSVMALRSQIYTKLGYNRQFPESIPGLNFDAYDSNSLILMVKEDDKLIGSFRIVLDSLIGIPSEKMYDFDKLRSLYNIAELSRLVVTPEARSGARQKGSRAFNELFSTAFMIGDIIDVERYVMVMKKAHEGRFLRFGGIEKLGETTYGNLNQVSPMLLWDFNSCSREFVDNVLNYDYERAA